MAIEIASQIYHFAPPELTVDEVMEDDTQDEEDESLENAKGGIYHNYLHDLESLWWIIVWTAFIYEKSPAADDDETLERALNQKSHFSKLFPGDMSMGMRVGFLKDPNRFDEYILQVPAAFSWQLTLIRTFRKALVAFFHSVNQDITKPARLTGPKYVHIAILRALLKIDLPEIEVTSVLKRKDSKVNKRPAEEELPSPSQSWKRSRHVHKIPLHSSI